MEEMISYEFRINERLGEIQAHAKDANFDGCKKLDVIAFANVEENRIELLSPYGVQEAFAYNDADKKALEEYLDRIDSEIEEFEETKGLRNDVD